MKKHSGFTWKECFDILGKFLILTNFVERIVKLLDYIMESPILLTTNHSCIHWSGQPSE